MKIAYICTNYNNSDLTVSAVASIVRDANHDVSVFVVDNASDEKHRLTLEKLSLEDHRVHVIFNPENIGYFAGLNVGIDAALSEDIGIEWMIVGNNDLVFPTNFIESIAKLRDEFNHYCVISPDIITLDGAHQNPHVISKISSMRELFYDLYFSNYYLGMAIHRVAKLLPRLTRRGDEDEWRTPRKIYQGHGSCYLLTPKFFNYFKELWAPTFMMGEEFFLSLQLISVGEQVYYSPEVSVTHYWHGSLQDIPSRRRWAMARDAHLEYRKYVRVFDQHHNKYPYSN